MAAMLQSRLSDLPDDVFLASFVLLPAFMFIHFSEFFYTFSRDSHKAPRTCDIVYLLLTPQSKRDLLSPLYALAKY